jgi:hypothetical protein
MDGKPAGTEARMPNCGARISASQIQYSLSVTNRLHTSATHAYLSKNETSE